MALHEAIQKLLQQADRPLPTSVIVASSLINHELMEPRCSIAPNPAADVAELYCSRNYKDCRLTIYNGRRENVMEILELDPSTKLSIHLLTTGYYFYYAEARGRVVASGKPIVE